LPPLLRSLKVQIVLAITVLTLLFATSAFYSLLVIDQQRADAQLLRVAARLAYEQHQLAMQSMRYVEHAPRDFASYDRDLQFFFEDLQQSRSTLDQIITALSGNRFDDLPETADLAEMCVMPEAAQDAARRLEGRWRSFSEALDERIGEDPAAPRLEWAAQTIVADSPELEQLTSALTDELDRELSARAERARTVNRLLLGAAILVALGIALWFYWNVLRRLSRAVHGFRIVANGDFSHRVPVDADNEIGWLVNAFNQLSDRLDTLRRLLTRLEQGGDLETTLHTLSETLPHLMPVDWIGVLVVGVDGRIHLQLAFSDGQPDPIGQHSFSADHTLLEECLRTRQPLHIADVAQLSQLSEHYVFLRRLLDRGRRDAIFLPVEGSGGLQGVAVFASRFPNSYRSEHLELLRNLGVLIGVSLARTLQLVESQRLASIGQFASGIVHEIRNPLATIGLALEHLGRLQDLPDNSRKRVALATDEVARLERLLADILLYAKPLVLDRRETDLPALIGEVVASQFDERSRLGLALEPCPPLSIDRDRITQVLLNLLHNALQAAPPDGQVTVRCGPQDAASVSLSIHNGGGPIGARERERLFEPFFTTKPQGTGLGLPIARRLVEAHGGEIGLTSDAASGTTVAVTLPIQRPDNDNAAG
jgi:signal transduction histidine kinase/HAMP domain-containing protein